MYKTLIWWKLWICHSLKLVFMHFYSLFVIGNVSNSITGFNPFFCWMCHYLSSNKLIMHCFSLLVDVSFSKTSAQALCIGAALVWSLGGCVSFHIHSFGPLAWRMCFSLKKLWMCSHALCCPIWMCHSLKISIYAFFCGPMVNASFSKDSFHTYCFGIFLEDVSLS